MDEFTLVAGLAAGSRFAGGNLSLLIAPNVEGEQSPPELVSCAHQKFDGFGSLDRPNQSNGAVSNSHCVTVFDRAFRRGRKETGQASGFAGKNIHGDRVGSHGGGINPGFAMFYSEIVDKVAGLKVIGCVEDQIGVTKERLDVFAVKHGKPWIY